LKIVPFKLAHLQVSTLERRSLSQPRTVCTNVNCAEEHTVDGQRVKKFTIHCDPHCSVKGVQADCIDDPGKERNCWTSFKYVFNKIAIKNCSAMRASGGQTCRVCGCVWNVHMHVTYDMVPVQKAGVDEATKKRYKEITDRVKLKQKMLDDLETRVQELEDEKHQIINACAYFGLFLKSYSVLPYNDAMIGYLNLMIKEEKEKADQSQVRLTLVALL